jgi:hypothetical protein
MSLRVWVIGSGSCAGIRAGNDRPRFLNISHKRPILISFSPWWKVQKPSMFLQRCHHEQSVGIGASFLSVRIVRPPCCARRVIREAPAGRTAGRALVEDLAPVEACNSGPRFNSCRAQEHPHSATIKAATPASVARRTIVLNPRILRFGLQAFRS